MQKTLGKSFEINDIGLHSGDMVRMVVKPAGANAGIIFVRTDVSDRNNIIPALWSHVVDTRLCTVIGNEAGVTVGTIEHLMAALRGCGIDNAIVELDAPEVPVMDGSSAAFVEAIDAAGIVEQNTKRRAIRVLREVSVEKDGKKVTLSPSDSSVFKGKIVYDHPVIGTQEQGLQLINGNFRHELANARTFGLMRDVEAMRTAGLALGGSLDNAVVLDDDKVLNKDGLRHDDEFIRHKLLDAIGDLYLAGAPVLGAYVGQCAGHALNNQVLHALFADDANWEYVEMQDVVVSPVPASEKSTYEAAVA